MWLYHRGLSRKVADKMANSADLDQTAPISLMWIYTVCPRMCVQKLRNLMVDAERSPRKPSICKWTWLSHMQTKWGSTPQKYIGEL